MSLSVCSSRGQQHTGQFIKENVCLSHPDMAPLSPKEYLKEQLLATNGSEEAPLPSQPLKVTLRDAEEQSPVFNPFHVYKAFSEHMLDQVCGN